MEIHKKIFPCYIQSEELTSLNGNWATVVITLPYLSKMYYFPQNKHWKRYTVQVHLEGKNNPQKIQSLHITNATKWNS